MLHQDHNKSNRHHGNRWSRPLALFLALAMTVSLGADLTSTMQVYATNSTNVESTENDDNANNNTGKTLTCGKTEHTHTDDCYTTVTEERSVQICGQDESEGHHHSENCYTTTTEQKLICGQEESDEHTHTDDCYETVEKTELNCDQQESDGHTHTDACYETQTVTERKLDCGKEDHQHSEDCYTTEGNTDNSANSKQNNGGFEDEDIDTQSDETDATKMTITSITGKGTTYDASKDLFETNLRIDFSLKKSDVVEANYSYYYDYPAGIVVPDEKLGTEDLYDSNGKKAGTWTLSKLSDGNYRAYFNFDEDYVQKMAGDDSTIDGHGSFSGKIQGYKEKDDGSIEVDGGDTGKLVINAEDISYPKGEDHYYDLSATKVHDKTKLDSNGELSYTVTVNSYKGTPGEINFVDTVTIDPEGLKLAYKDNSVKVTKVTYRRYTNANGTTWDSLKTDSETPVTGINASYNSSTGKMTMTLPKIDAATDATDENGNACKEWTSYQITYTYTVSDIPAGTTAINNEVSVGSNRITYTTTDSVTVDARHTMTKIGSYDAGNNEILWMITVNANKIDIAGATLTDSMLGEITKDKIESVEPNTGYTINTDATTGKITNITFTAPEGSTTNKNTYVIKYRTSAEGKNNGDKVTNNAHYQKGETSIDKSSEVTIQRIQGVGKEAGTVTVNGNTLTIPWKVSLWLPSEGAPIPAGTVISDNMLRESSNQWETDGDAHYMTRQQVLDWASKIYWTNASNTKVGDAALVENGTTKTGFTIKFKGSDNTEYTYDQIYLMDSATQTTFTNWSVEFKEAFQQTGAKNLVFEYNTTADITNLDQDTTKTYKNLVTVDGKEAGAKVEYKKPYLIKTDENNKTETTYKSTADGNSQLIWKVKLQSQQELNSLEIEDTLPTGVTLAQITTEHLAVDQTDLAITMTKDTEQSTDEKTVYTVSGSNTDYTVKGSYDTSTNVLKLTLKRTQEGQKLAAQNSWNRYTFVLTCDIDKDQLATLEGYEKGKAWTFTNDITGKADEAAIKGASQSQEWTDGEGEDRYKGITKDGLWDNNSKRLKYTLEINPDGKDIVPNTEVLTVKDVLSYQTLVYAHKDGTDLLCHVTVELSPSEVKLYKAQVGADGKVLLDDDGHMQADTSQEITDWSWTVEKDESNKENSGGWGICTSTITAKNVPDSTPLVMVYEYVVKTDVPENYTSDKLYIENSATIRGTSYADDKKDHFAQWSDAEREASVDTDRSYTLYKVATGRFGITIPGATFTLQYYDTTAYEWKNANKTYTTGSDGTIHIYGEDGDNGKWDGYQYKYNVLYRVVETAAADGYFLPDNPVDYAAYFYFSPPTGATTNVDGTAYESMMTTYPTGVKKTDVVDLTTGYGTKYVENDTDRTQVAVQKKWKDVYGNEISAPAGASITYELWQIASDVAGEYKGSSTFEGSITVDGQSGDAADLWSLEKATYKSGTQVTFTLTSSSEWAKTINLKLNDDKLDPTSTQETLSTYDETTGQWSQYSYVATYSFRLASGDNRLTGTVNNQKTFWTMSAITTTPPGDLTETKIGTFTLNNEEGWSRTHEKLLAQSQTQVGDKTVKTYYSYYVKEVSVTGVTGYTTSYDNNSGVSSGTIYIINQHDGTYELPETGGTGTLPYTLGGYALILSTMFYCFYTQRKRRGGCN